MRVPGSISTCALLLALASPLAAQEANGASTRAGVYTDAQAQLGKRLYDRVCVDCHEMAEFRSGDFLGQYVGGNLYDLYQYMIESMPEDAPGSRSPSEYAAAVAFILRANGFPAGQADLPADEARLKAIRFEAPPAGGTPR